jgi:hypothetical protein
MPSSCRQDEKAPTSILTARSNGQPLAEPLLPLAALPFVFCVGPLPNQATGRRKEPEARCDREGCDMGAERLALKITAPSARDEERFG